MSRALGTVDLMVKDTFLKVTSEQYNADSFDKFRDAVSLTDLSLQELSDKYLNENNRSGVLKTEMMRLSLSETSSLARSTFNISNRQISVGQQSEIFISSFNDKLKKLVVTSKFDNPEQASFKNFMYESQLFYSEKGGDFQSEIDKEINGIVSEHLGEDPIFSSCNNFIDCTSESADNFINEVHPPEVRFGRDKSYVEPAQKNDMRRDNISGLNLAEIQADFNEYAKSKGWSNEL